MNNLKKNNAITLIALVITIIVMLILVAVTISMAVNGGLFEYAGKATTDTKVKMKEEQELANIEVGKNYEYLIAKYTNEEEKLNPKGKIPTGATYYDKSENITLNAGQDFPEEGTGDIYTYTDYEYHYNQFHHGGGYADDTAMNGWSVHVKNGNTDKSIYDAFLQSVNNKPIKRADWVFYECTSMTTAPIIPDTVTSINGIFCRCILLKTYIGNSDGDGDFSNYIIPNGVTSMNNSFGNCSDLISAPSIPSSVAVISRCFEYCTSLTERVIISANPTTYYACFNNTTQPITLTGSSTKLSELAATANNGNAQVAP